VTINDVLAFEAAHGDGIVRGEATEGFVVWTSTCPQGQYYRYFDITGTERVVFNFLKIQ